MQEEKTNNYDNIIYCSIGLFSQKGYDAVGVQEIVDQSKITKPTLYHYFGSKKGLLEAIIERYGNMLHELVMEKSRYEGDITKNLNDLALSMMKFAKENREFYRMQLAMIFSSPENEANQLVSAMNDKIFKLVETLFKEASKDHGNMIGRHKEYALTFIGMINTYIGIAMNGHADPKEKMIYKAVHQFMHGIFS
jgi:AcrR family transcriptional regulator